MSGLPRAMRTLIAAALTLSAAVPMATSPLVAPALAAPSSVTIVGSFQAAAGCPGDWQPDCAATHLSYDATDDIWQGTFTIPAGAWEYKATIDDSWAVNYGLGGAQNGPNIPLNLAAPTTLKFYFDPDSHWVTDNHGWRIVTAPGDYQAQLGCPGDWQPDCLRSWLEDLDGDGTYTLATAVLNAGNYEVKAAIDESWSENYGQGGVPNGPNIGFSVPFSNASVVFKFVSSTNALTVTVGAQHDNDVWWNDLGHNSRDPLYRSPGGAVPTGTPVTVRLRAAAGDLTEAKVRVWNDRTNAQSILNMAPVADDGQYEWWEATIPASADPTIFWYRFIARDGTATAYYEDDAARTGGWGQTFGESPDNSWQLTVYDPSFTTPDWVKNATIYQIFADRFRDGNAANDPAAGQFFYNESPTIFRSGTSDWNAPICDPRDAAGTCPGIYSQNFYGGDLQGVIDKLDYLQDLGVNAVYLNPIFRSPSNHKYDTTDYRQIDPAFGDLAKLQQLAADMHSRGMHLILDGVFNHTSSDSIYFDRYGRYASVGACESPASPYRNWYFFTDVTPGTGMCASSTGVALGANYTSWFGFDSLPKLNSANADVRDFFWNGGVNAIGPYWLSWADGWRLDVGGDVDPGVTNDPSNTYWEGFRDAVRAANSDAYIVGEEWGNATPWTLGQEWDATMNYQFSSALLSFFRDETLTDNDHNSGSSAGELAPLTATQFSERLLNLQERYPPQAFAALMNLLDSHDTNRALFLLDENADETGTTRATYENPAYDWSDAINRLKGVVLLQATLPGAPTIYYGDEVGLVAPPTKDGSTFQDDPYNRIPYPWLDQSGTPYYAHLQTAAGQAQLLDRYTLLFNTRADHPALRTGSLDFLLTDDADMTVAYGRKMADSSDAAVVVVNRSGSVQNVQLDVAGYLPVGAQFGDVLDGNALHTVDGSGMLAVSVPANGGALLVLSGSLAAAPAAVNDLAVSSTAANTINLDWSAAAGADSYDVYRSLLSGGGYQFVANTAATSYGDNGLDNGKTYYYVVVARSAATLLTSGYSNEASGTPGYDLNDSGNTWFNLQWPPSIIHTISTTNPTPTIYAWIWINGVTNAPGATPGIRAQIGYGPDASQPNGAWIWKEASYNGDSGNNDEFSTNLLPDQTGEFDYAARWSGDGGLTWYLADLNGPQRDGTLDNPGALTVNASDDATPPSAPVLSLDGVTASSVSLSWTAASDDAELAGYEVFRDGVEIAQPAANIVDYVDEDVVTGQTYSYYVKAFDTSFNRSAASNTIDATAENRLVQVTFTVGVPAFTPADATVYVTGSIAELGPWNPSAYPMTDNGDGTWSRTFAIPDNTSFEYKFTRGSWDTVEWWGSITNLANRGPVTATYGATGTMTIDNTATDWGNGPDGDKAIQNWRDPLVTSYSPADGATNVDVATTVAVNWSRPMASNTSFSVSGPGGAVSGTFAVSNAGQTVTFTPGSALAYATQYDVSVTGQTDDGGNLQQVPASFSFTTEAVVLESITVSPHDPTILNGKKQQFAATGHYSDGTTADLTSVVAWMSSNTRVLTVSATGLAHAKKEGTATVSATYVSISGQSLVTVAKK